MRILPQCKNMSHRIPKAAVWTVLLLLLPVGLLWSVEITICHTNDVHGGIDRTGAVYMNPDFPPPLGGGASMKVLVDHFRTQASESKGGFLLLDAGDFFQGTPIGSRTDGLAIVDYMNRLEYDAVTVGNHEFDLGKEVFIGLTKRAGFPFLACNLLDAETGELVDFVRPYVMKNVAGINVAIIGAVTSATPFMSYPDHVAGLDFAPEIPALKKYVQEVRGKGADLVIALVHTGLPYDWRQGWENLQQDLKDGLESDRASNAMELAHLVLGIDVFLCGHIHVGYAEPWEDPVTHALCFQTWGRGSSLGVVTLEIDDDTHTLSGYRLYGDDDYILTLFEEEFARDPDEAIAIDTVVARVEKGMDEPIGSTLEALTRGGRLESLMGNLVADAMREQLNGDFAFTNKGGIRAEISAGPIAPRDIFGVIPFENQLVLVNVTGDFLMRLFESKMQRPGSGLYISGGKVVIDPDAVQGQRVAEFEVGGMPIDPAKTYRIVTTDYLLQGNSGMGLLLDVPESNATYTGSLMRGAVEEYIARNSPLKPKLDGRWSEVSRSGSL